MVIRVYQHYQLFVPKLNAHNHLSVERSKKMALEQDKRSQEQEILRGQAQGVYRAQCFFTQARVLGAS